MSTIDVRLNILNSVRDALAELISTPPKLRDNQHAVDLGKVCDKLEEISVFWDAYIKAAKIETDRYAIRNMIALERDKYLLCHWWITILNSTITAAKADRSM